MSKYAPLLYDSFYTYAQALSAVIKANPSSLNNQTINGTVPYRNGQMLQKAMAGLNFKGKNKI
jgi:hypothetical protein